MRRGRIAWPLLALWMGLPLTVIGCGGEDASVPRVKKGLKSKSASARARAARDAAQLEPSAADDAAADLIVMVREDSDAAARSEAIVAIGQIGTRNKQVVPTWKYGVPSA